jgi:branched-chain amino acid transport system permease protein
MKFMVGSLYVPIPELLTLVLALGISFGVWAGMRYTDLGKALRAMAEDGPITAAFGIDSRLLSLVLAGGCAALAGVAGVCLALTFTLTPSQIFAWIGVVFAAVMLGGLGSALGPLVAGTLIGVSEAVTMAVTAPSWAPIVSFTLLIIVLVLRPGRAG